jgi:hypothetical protein
MALRKSVGDVVFKLAVERRWGTTLTVLLILLGLVLTPHFTQSGIAQSGNLLKNGDFEGGFVYDTSCNGYVGKGWGCFTNNGQTYYGFYDDRWPPVVATGKHSQLIELNTQNLGIADPDRYAGIFQTVQVQAGTAYAFALRGMIRTTDNMSAERDPFRYRVQFGWSYGAADWRNVTQWVDVGWNTYYDRLRPGRFSRFNAKFLAQEDQVTVYVRVWKKWGDVGEEIDVNLDTISLVPTATDATVLPTLAPTARPPDAPPPLLLNGGTPVAQLPTPPSIYGQRYIPPAQVQAGGDWPRVYGDHVSFAYPATWQPTRNELAGTSVVEEFRLGIPNLLYDQILGFSSVPFGDLRPPEAVLTTRFAIGGQEGVKWVRQGPNYIIYEYCTRGLAGQGNFCVRVLVTVSNPMLELQLDRLVRSIIFY